jgi:hypothetical protein
MTFNTELWNTQTPGAAGGYEIERSLRFNSADTAYLSRTPASAGNRTTFTWAAWVKLTTFGSDQTLFAGWDGSASNQFEIRLQSDSTFFLNTGGASGSRTIATTAAVFRDPSAWYHLTCAVDTTQASASNHFKFYVNNVLQTLSLTASGPQNLVTQVNGTFLHHIGVARALSRYFNGYLADVHFIDGQALDPTDFGEFDDNGVWQPIDASGLTYGTNGFHLDFSDNSSASALGTDAAGSNDWTVNNIVATSVGTLTSAITAVSNTTTTLSYSAQFVKASSESLSTNQFDANKRAGLFACWMKHEGGTSNTDDPWIFGAGTTNGAHTILFCDSANKLTFYDYDAAPTKQFGVNTGVTSLRDGNWHHVLVKWDTTQATSTNRVKIYIDGNEETLSGSYPGPSAILRIGGDFYPHYIADQPYERKWWDCKLAQVVYLNGAQSYGPSDFIEADGRPKTSLSITFGNNSSYFTFSNSGNIGANSSGFGSDWTVNGTPTQSTSDTPSKTTSTLTFTDTTNFGSFNVGDAVTQNDDAASGTVYTITSGSSQMAIKDVTGTFATTKQLEGPAEGADADIDSLFDSPTNGTQTDTGAGGEVSGNYCTWNPLKLNTNGSLANGNLDWSSSTGGGMCAGTIGVSSGKWYWEITVSGGTNCGIGVFDPSDPLTTYIAGTTVKGIGYYGGSGSVFYYGGSAAYGNTFGSGDVIGVALDLDNGKIYFSKNGTWQNSGDPAAQTNPARTGLSGVYAPAIDAGASNAHSASLNTGQRAFAYPLSGFKALCTANLDDPTIADGSQYFNAAIWSGDGTNNRNIPTGHSTDLVWIKRRNSTNNHTLTDIIRGVNVNLRSSTTGAETTDPNSVTSFDADGFSVGSDGAFNGSGGSFVGWSWDGGSSTDTNNTDGTGTTNVSVRANQSAGFSIVTYTGGSSTPANSDSGDSFGHGLGVAPQLVICKKRTGTNSWPVYHASTALGALVLDGTNALDTTSYLFAKKHPSSSVVYLGNNPEINNSSHNYVAYCFAPVDGYSAFGSYTGNGSSDGPFVYTGHRSRWILLKNTNYSGASWVIIDTARDSYNVTKLRLMPNTSQTEINSSQILDITSNGFKVRDTDTYWNGSGNSIIYAAFAENPFKTARAR